MTIGKKLFISFTVILLLLVLVGVTSYVTISVINGKAEIERENLRIQQFFAEKVTDHLEWVSDVRPDLPGQRIQKTAGLH